MEIDRQVTTAKNENGRTKTAPIHDQNRGATPLLVLSSSLSGFGVLNLITTLRGSRRYDDIALPCGTASMYE
jgi:hypothetical protein